MSLPPPDGEVEQKPRRERECKEPAYYCVRVCSTFPTLDWLQGVDCQSRCEEHWGEFKQSWDFFKEHGICSWYDEGDDADDGDDV